MIFQALGAKYSLRTALKHLITRGTPTDSEVLRQALAARYNGTATLYHKGRAALAEAVRLTTGGTGKVAISGLTCYSMVQAIEAAGCEVVYVDINEKYLHFSGAELSETLQKNSDIKAVVVHNMLGIPVDMTAIESIAKANNLALIEDLAHSAGAHYKDGREVGTVGDIAMLSFGKDKALDVVNGGALIVRTAKMSTQPVDTPSKVDQLRDRWYPFIAWTSRALYPIIVGRYVMAASIKLRLVSRSADGDVTPNETMPHWQAKRALPQVKRLTTTAIKRRSASKKYLEQLGAYIPDNAKEPGAALVRVPLVVENRDQIVMFLAKHGIQVNDIWYDVPVSPRRMYKDAKYREDACPIAVRTATRLLNLPTHERITTKDINKITQLVGRMV